MHSQAFKRFKNSTGQANHFLITIMIGLDAVEDGAQKREDFHTTWNPKDTKVSVIRSRQYAIKSALAWTVDNLDMYFRLCNREPRLFSEAESLEIAQTGHSVYKKLVFVVNNHAEITADKYAYVDLLICWRNNSVHFDAENKLLPASLHYFKNIPHDDAVTKHYHLDVNRMLTNFEQGDCPTLKEVATLISMTIHFVEELDTILLQNIQQYLFLSNFLHQLLKNEDHKPSVFDFTNTTAAKRRKKLKQLFFTNGIESDFYNVDGERFLDEVSGLREEEFQSQFTPTN